MFTEMGIPGCMQVQTRTMISLSDETFMNLHLQGQTIWRTTPWHVINYSYLQSWHLKSIGFNVSFDSKIHVLIIKNQLFHLFHSSQWFHQCSVNLSRFLNDMCGVLPGRKETQSPLGALEFLAAGGSRKSLMLGWGVWACRGLACCCWGRGPVPKNSCTPAPQLPPGPCTPGRRFHLRRTARCHAASSLWTTHSDPCTQPERNNKINIRQRRQTKVYCHIIQFPWVISTAWYAVLIQPWLWSDPGRTNKRLASYSTNQNDK